MAERNLWLRKKIFVFEISFQLRKKIFVFKISGHKERYKKISNTLSYTSSKVDYNVGESIYTIPSDMNLNIRSGTAGYNNKILISDGNFSLGKNENVNIMTPAIKNHKTNSLETPAMKSTQTVVNSERTADLEQIIRQTSQQASLDR